MNRAKKDAPPRFPEFREAFLELMGDMTLEQFAKKLGMSRATVGFYAAGQRIPDALGLKKIAEKCNVSADWLLGLTNIQTNDTDLRNVCEYTGLSEETISELSLYAKQKNIESSFLSRFFESMVISDDSIETICNFLIKAANANTVDELFRIKKLDELTDDEPAQNIIEHNNEHLLQNSHDGSFRISAEDAGWYFLSTAKDIATEQIGIILEYMEKELRDAFKAEGFIQEGVNNFMWRLVLDEEE